MGLGLYGAQRTARSHGGDIRFVSAPGEGATFYVQLPAWHEGAGERSGTTAAGTLPAYAH